MKDLLARLIAWVVGLFRRMPALPAPVIDWPETTGPDPEQHPTNPVGQVVRANWGEVNAHDESPPQPWVSGWYTHAKQAPAHRGRVGPVIVPKAVVVHTTDMMPFSHDALVRGWQTRPGAGNCAHFLIGRTPEQGITQFCQITRNGNHAGGRKGHGWYVLPSGRKLHPNTLTIGIELHAAGRLRWDGSRWVHPLSGRSVPADEVFVVNGRGWHRVTPYQLQALQQLLADLEPCLLHLPEGTRIQSNGVHAEQAVPWAAMTGVRVVGHATLDPRNKSDPGPQVTAWLKENT